MSKDIFEVLTEYAVNESVRLCIKNNFFLYSKKEKTPCNKDKINVY